jgi:hypothetical protein
MAQAVARFYVGYPRRGELPVLFVVSELFVVPVVSVL